MDETLRDVIGSDSGIGNPPRKHDLAVAWRQEPER